MANESGRSVSLWAATAQFPRQSALETDTTADVCIVGAGITGLLAAYALAGKGRSVVVLDDGAVGGGETARTTAHLTAVVDTRFAQIAKRHGADTAKAVAASHARAIDAIERLVAEEGLVCGFERVDGYLLAEGGDVQTLAREEEAAREAGLAVEMTRAPLPGRSAALRFPAQAQVQPLDLLFGLRERLEEGGVRIYGGTHAAWIEGGSEARVTTAAGRTIRVGAVIVATHTPINDRVAVHTKQAAYRTFVLAARVPAGLVDKALYWDTEDPYHYVRCHQQGGGPTWLIVGGEDHKTGQADDAIIRYRRLEAWMRDRFPSAGPVEFRWSGQVFEPVDGLAMIGRNPGDDANVFVATGFSGNGTTYAAVAGELLADLILGRDNPWAEVYDPARLTLGAAAEFLRENLNVAAQYATHLTPGDVDSADAIAPGTGAIVRDGAAKLAVYRDHAGGLHPLSAQCTHLGCVVAWNSGEGTWDCPCHGSRFTTDGRVISGPANRALSPAEVPVESI